MKNKYIKSFNILLVMLIEAFLCVFSLLYLITIIFIKFNVDEVRAEPAKHVHLDEFLFFVFLGDNPLVLREEVARGLPVFAPELFLFY